MSQFFMYGERSNVPEARTRGGNTYRIVSDHLGSVRLVVDASTGAVAQAMSYDAWGNVLSDSAPGFQPFGFAGGLYDRDLSLVRFGARDYDPETGRWTSKDPLQFGGGFANVYVYVYDDPINLVDSNGHYVAVVVVAGAIVLVAVGLEFLAAEDKLNDVRERARNDYPGDPAKNNAMRHCIASCELAVEGNFGAAGAAAGGYIREKYQSSFEGQDPSETSRDIHNNLCGVERGNAMPPGPPGSDQQYCTQECEAEYENGTLQ